jgi:hypothetical protein
MCFDAKRLVAGIALPSGVTGSTLIDWWLVYPSQMFNQAGGTMPTFTPWPGTNGLWGTRYFSITMDSSSNAGQDGELNLTGTPSFINGSQNVNVFYDIKGKQNPSAANPQPPNWFFYWSQTTAYAGTMTYDPRNAAPNAYGRCRYDMPPGYPCYLSDGCCGAYATPRVGQNANQNLNYIDTFAWGCRHEWAHHNDFTAWWGAGGTTYPNDPLDRDADLIPNAMEGPGGIGAAGGGPYNPLLTDSYPADGLGFDCERHAVFTQGAWVVGSANASDWAYPSSQWNP